MIDDPKIENEIKGQIDGITTRIIENSNKQGICISSGKKTNTVAYFAKAY